MFCAVVQVEGWLDVGVSHAKERSPPPTLASVDLSCLVDPIVNIVLLCISTATDPISTLSSLDDLPTWWQTVTLTLVTTYRDAIDERNADEHNIDERNRECARNGSGRARRRSPGPSRRQRRLCTPAWGSGCSCSFA